MANVCPLPPGQSLSWKLLGPPAEDPAEKLAVFVPWRTWHSLSWRCSPGHGSGAGINPRRSPKGFQTPQPFSARTLSSLGLGGFVFFSAKGPVPVYEAAALATRQDANLSREVGTTLQDCCLPRRTFWLNSWENGVIFNRGPAPRKPGWVGYEGLQPRGPESGQDPEQEGDSCSPAFCGRLE